MHQVKVGYSPKSMSQIFVVASFMLVAPTWFYPAYAEVSPGVNVRVDQTAPGGRQIDPSVAVNPLDRRHIIVLSGESFDRNISDSRIRYYVSRDGGQTWKTSGILPGWESNRQGHGTVTFCSDGTAFATYYDINPNYAFRVLRSMDGGETWEVRTPARVHTGNENKPQILCDESGGAYDGRLYVRYGRIGQIYVVYSDDQGETWSSPAKATPGETGSNNPGPMVVGPDSQLWVGWSSSVFPEKIQTSTSFDGGSTWEAAETVADTWGDPPVLAVDRSGGPTHGMVHCVYSWDSGTGDSDLFYSRRPPGAGGAWLPRLRLNDDSVGNGKNQDLPAASVDPDGILRIVWMDRRNDTGDGSIEVWGKISRDGGGNFEADFPISDQPFLEPTGDGANLGGHAQVLSSANLFFPFWPDRRIDDGDIFSAAVRDFALAEVTGLMVAKNGSTTISWTSQDPTYGEETVYDLISGDLDELRADAGFDRATCLGEDIPDTPYVDSRVGPNSGFGYYYLARSQNGASDSSFGASNTSPDARVGIDLEPQCF